MGKNPGATPQPEDLTRLRTIVVNLLTAAAKSDTNGGSKAALRAWQSLSAEALDKAVRQEQRLKDAFEAVADEADSVIERDNDVELVALAQAASTVAVVEAMTRYFDSGGC